MLSVQKVVSTFDESIIQTSKTMTKASRAQNICQYMLVNSYLSGDVGGSR